MLFIRICLLLLLFFWIIGFLSPIIFDFSFLTNLMISKFYSPVCHQVTEKSFELNGIHFLVCARCSGIYFGAFILLVLILFKSNHSIDITLKWFVISSVLLLVDVLASTAGIYSYNKPIAFFIGMFFGFMILNFIVQGSTFTFAERKNADVV